MSDERDKNLDERRPAPNAQGRARVEIAAAGLDEQNQLIAGDPFGGLSAVGLRVPTAASVPGNLASRYLMMLASLTVPEGRRVRIIGLRQLLTIGFIQEQLMANVVVEFEVTTPTFKFVDGNVSWHLRQMAMTEPFTPLQPGNVAGITLFPGGPGVPNNPLRNAAWKMSDTPALLFQGMTIPNFDPFYTNLVGYTAPNAGRPWGRDLGGLGTFYDLRAPWRDSLAWQSLDIPVEGPVRIALFASVAQTEISGRPVITPNVADPIGLSLSPEDRFILNYPFARYYRIGGSLIVKNDDEET